MKLKLAACAAAVLLAAPVFAQTTVVAPSAPSPAAITHYVPPGGSLSIVVGPTPAAIAAASNTSVLGGPGASSLEKVRIDVTNGWNIPPEAGRRADFQRWLRLWP
jgi:hypothetical protein